MNRKFLQFTIGASNPIAIIVPALPMVGVTQQLITSITFN